MNEGQTITELSRQAHVPITRLLDWEARGFITPLLKRKGRRVVRFYTAAVTARVVRLKALTDDGYRLQKAVEILTAEAGSTAAVMP